MMLNIILISGLLFIMLLFVYNGNLIKKFNKKERLRIVIILLFGFTFIVLFKNKDNLMNRFNKKESFSIGASLTQRFTSPNVPDVNVEISDRDLLEAGFRLDVDGNPVNATSGSRLDAVRIDQLAQMFIQRVRDADPDFPVNNVNNFRFDPSRRQIDTEARTITNTTGMSPEDIAAAEAAARETFENYLDQVRNLNPQSIQEMSDTELTELINDLYSTYRSQGGPGFPPDTPEADQIELNEKLNQMMDSAANRRANAARQAEANAAGQPLVDDPENDPNIPGDEQEPPVQQRSNTEEQDGSNAEQSGNVNTNQRSNNQEIDLDELPGELDPAVKAKMETETVEAQNELSIKQQKNENVKQQLNSKGKPMNSMERYFFYHPDQKWILGGIVAAPIALGVASLAMLRALPGAALETAEKLGNLAEKLIDKREIMMKNGLITPEMALNLSWSDLFDVVAEHFYGDLLAVGGDVIGELLNSELR